MTIKSYLSIQPGSKKYGKKTDNKKLPKKTKPLLLFFLVKPATTKLAINER
jgi:hypothetical protein